jgi:hypothetical protein
MDRYIIDSDPQTPALVADGVRWLVAEANAIDAPAAAVLVPQVQSIPNPSDAFGRAVSRDERAVLSRGRTLTILTTRQLPSSFPGPVLVVWANTKMAEQAEHLEPAALCATSWEPNGLAEWVRVWGATDPRTGEHRPAQLPPPALAGAVANISFHPPGDVLHPSDKARAVDALRALTLCGYELDPPMLRALAIRHGWLPRAADRLAELAEKFKAGKPVRGGTKMTKTRACQVVERFLENGA